MIKTIVVLLVLSMVLLTILVPGGPIETRDFSHIDSLTLGTFNVFLTSTGIISLLIVPFVWQRHRWAFLAAILCSMSYLAVYLLDLGKIFPVSSSPMPAALFVIEMIGSTISIPLAYLSYKAFLQGNSNSTTRTPKYFKHILAALLLIGIGIVIFATKSAMGV